MMPTSLAAIVALTRAGALDLAVRRFKGGAFPPDDPAALTVKGRLLKEMAIRSSGEERQRLYLESADAYERSAEIRPSTYPLINAATLARLGGDERRAAAAAEKVLQCLDEQPEEPETPYYRIATRAEALLLLERYEEARAGLREAIELAPRAWEDHASTLRQFRLICETLGHDHNWLDAHRPPRSLHFGGHMSFQPEAVSRAQLDEKISCVLEEENVGFGYGALAAGADIIIAEALVARGAELHVVLPGSAETFAGASVDPFGKAWRRRFDTVLERAETIRQIPPVDVLPGRNAICLADQIAMGVAVMNSRRLSTEAIQLLVLADEQSPPMGATARARSMWAKSGRRQRLVQAPREATDAPTGIAEGMADGHLRAILAINIAPGASDEQVTVEARLADLQDAVGSLPRPSLGPYIADRQVLLAYESVADAARASLSLAKRGHPVGGHYLIARSFRDPFSGADRLHGEATGAAEGAARSTPQGASCVTEDFAAALTAATSGQFIAEYVGELDAPDREAPLGLYVLK